MRIIVGSRHFEESLHASFAALSGDVNPMHVDPIAARRTQAGAPVVHGIHALLWALDVLSKDNLLRGRYVALEVHFRNFIYVGDRAELIIERDTGSKIRCKIDVGGVAAIALSVALDAPAPTDPASPSSFDLQNVPGEIRARSLEEMRDESGNVTVANVAGIGAMFPNVAARFGTAPTASIAALSTLVGMVCPGLHSIFAGVAITLGSAQAPTDVRYTVASIDERYALLEIGVSAAGIAGSITAFKRQPPIAQTPMAQLRQRVRHNEFAEVSALVIGGSRGLGALSARLLAAGGAQVMITYRVGVADATALCEDIGVDRCRKMQYDALLDAAQQLSSLPCDINQLYYFATSQIYRPAALPYNVTRFKEFSAIYVDGFDAACRALLVRQRQPVIAFYPSSTFVEMRPRAMTEYAMAKAAAEILCADLNRFAPGLRIVCGRLPRLLTDQTASVMPSDLENPVDILLPYIRQMCETTPKV
jgi:NAD(P)-dependent dehydrogenase (short-subunit alcohol dehydrogenase family)